jgi:hypothetical protein
VAQHSGQYLLAGAVVFGISFLLISVQCLRVALANPVNSLKDE